MTKRECHLRRFAARMVAQLPEEEKDAVAVIAAAIQILALENGQKAAQVTEMVSQLVS